MSGWVEAFIVVAAIAIVIQTAIMWAMFTQLRKSLREFTRIADNLQRRVDPILTRVNRILEDSEDRIASIIGDASEITRLARGQAQKVDRVFTEMIERLRAQLIRTDHLLTGALEVIDEAGSKFRKTLWGPLQQASAVLNGLKVGLDFLRNNQRRRQHRHESSTPTQDEELFI